MEEELIIYCFPPKITMNFIPDDFESREEWEEFVKKMETDSEKRIEVFVEHLVNNAEDIIDTIVKAILDGKLNVYWVSRR